ncbi:hypothetical protein DFH06DRAFT_1297042 [Mycena polygramma]|nr:hypothetical protein DFH06DRAFT_1297042 [Mycena polygramma]
MSFTNIDASSAGKQLNSSIQGVSGSTSRHIIGRNVHGSSLGSLRNSRARDSGRREGAAVEGAKECGQGIMQEWMWSADDNGDCAQHPDRKPLNRFQSFRARGVDLTDSTSFPSFFSGVNGDFLIVAASNDASARRRLRRSINYRSLRHQPPPCLTSPPSAVSFIRPYGGCRNAIYIHNYYNGVQETESSTFKQF